MYVKRNADVNESSATEATGLEDTGEERLSRRTKIAFMSGGTECSGYLYRADSAREQSPCVVLGHGFGGTQEGSIAATAVAFSEAGLSAFTFDYRNFGDSGGEPRQVININDQLEDWRSAITHVRSLQEIDPDAIAVWGSSLAGGHVIAVAAEDPQLAAVVSQIPFTLGFPRKVKGRTSSQTWRLLRVSFHDWLNGLLGGPRVYIPSVGPPDSLSVMATGEAEKRVQVMTNKTWRNEIAPGVLIDMAFWYRPGRRAKSVHCPLLFSLAENDKEGPVEMALRTARLAPFADVRRYPCTHFDFYDPNIRRTIVQDQVSFLRTHLFGLHGV